MSKNTNTSTLIAMMTRGLYEKVPRDRHAPHTHTRVRMNTRIKFQGGEAVKQETPKIPRVARTSKILNMKYLVLGHPEILLLTQNASASIPRNINSKPAAQSTNVIT